ncbi:MAG: hypothetical protein K9G59_19300 [Caulobacter sp.]|nr:hypothetical protein [Caulobacter sp.]
MADDVFIILRVAGNLWNGHGPYVNPGEPVAANTSLFWPMALAPLFGLFAQAGLIKVLTALSLGLVLLTVLALAAAARSAAGAAAMVALMLLTPATAGYGATAWEHVPQMLLVTLGFLMVMGRVTVRHEAGADTDLGILVLCLSFLVRPDSAALVALPGAWLLLRAVTAPTPRRLAVLAACAAIPAAHLGLHYYWYNDFVPNTFYLKVTGDAASFGDGLRYLAVSLVDGGNAAYPLSALVLAAGLWRRLDTGERLTAASVGLFCLWVVWVGGDVFRFGRFLLAVQGIAIFLVVDLGQRVLFGGEGSSGLLRLTRAGAVMVPMLLVAAVMQQESLLDSERPVYGVPGGLIGVQPKDGPAQIALAPVIRRHIEPKDGEIGLFYLGALSYYLPEYAVADFLGKADPAVARGPAKWGPVGHNKWDFDHSLGNRRVAVVPLPEQTASTTVRRRLVEAETPFSFASELSLHPILNRDFVWLSPRLLGQNHAWGLWVRADLAPRFAAALPLPPAREEIHLGLEGGGALTLQGWADPEPWGRWTDGRFAALLARVPAGRDLRLTLDADAAIPPGDDQRVRVAANGHDLGEIVFTAGQASRGWQAIIPASVTGEGLLFLRFEISRPVVPADLGWSADSRALGLGVRRLRLAPVAG